MTYYLKYRPQKLDDLDLKEVRETLIKTVKSGKIPHVFLFSGPKGSGKTSAARILAKVVNCESTSVKLRGPGKVEPCSKCPSCLAIAGSNNIDVVELDAASHRGIDDVRILRDAVKLAPARAKKKVYIIDEAHMLTKEASNAFLKTLEEPPPHVMFILATTNPEKLIDTIRSRAFSLEFKKASIEELTRSLSRVAKGERIKVERETLDVIAQASDGSFRDATKILEQLVTEEKSLKKTEVEEFLFQRRSLNIDKIISLIVEKDTKSLITEIEKVVARGGSMSLFCEAIISRLRAALLAKVGMEAADIDNLSKEDIISLIKLFTRALVELPSAVLEQIPVELAIIEWGEKKEKRQKSKVKTESSRDNPHRDRSKKRSNKSRKGDMISEDVWRRILSEIKPKNTSTEALLRAARPIGYDGSTLTLGVFYKFHKEKLETAFHKRILEGITGEILGSPVRIECTLTEPPEKVTRSEVDTKRVKEVEKERSEEVVLTESDSVLTEGEDDDIIKVAKEIFGS